MSEIERCPRCSAPLQAVRLQYFDNVVLAENWEVLSAEPSAQREIVWQIHCERGHRLPPAAPTD